MRTDSPFDLKTILGPNRNSFGGKLGSEKSGFKRDQEEMNCREHAGTTHEQFCCEQGQKIGVFVSVWYHIPGVLLSPTLSSLKWGSTLILQVQHYFCELNMCVQQ